MAIGSGPGKMPPIMLFGFKPLAGSGLQFDKLEVIRHLEMGTAIDLSHHRWPEFARRCRNLDVVHAGEAANIIQLFREVLAKNAWY